MVTASLGNFPEFVDTRRFFLRDDALFALCLAIGRGLYPNLAQWQGEV